MIAGRVESYGPWLAALAVGLAFFLFGAAGLYTFRQQAHVNQKLCSISVENRASQRATWNKVRDLLLSRSDDPEAVNDFIDNILRPIPVLECVDNQPVPKEG